MSEEKRKTEATFLIDDKSFLHLQEIEEGYYFAFMIKPVMRNSTMEIFPERTCTAVP